MKNTAVKIIITLQLLVAGIITNGQVCNIIQNNSFDQPPATVGGTVNQAGTSVPSWFTAAPWITPDVYPNFSIFMWDQSGNPPTNPNLSDEYIIQNLCQNVLVPGVQQYDLSLNAATTNRGLTTSPNGVLEVLLSDGVNNVVVATIPNLTLAMTNYQFNNITNLIPNAAYNRVIIRPVAYGGGTMDIIVDNIVLGSPAPTGTKYVLDVVCCQQNQITYPGSMVGFDGITWIDQSTGLVAGNTQTITVTPNMSGNTYLVQKTSTLCSGNNCDVFDTVVLRCCGGDNDWEFSDVNGITSSDQIHRTGDVNIGNIAIVSGAPDIAKLEVKHNDNARWDCFMLNGGGNGRVLRLKGGFSGGQQSIFQVEANGATDYTEDNIRLIVRADGRVGINTTTPNGTLHVNGTTWNTSGVWQTSDKRFKENIEVISNAADILKQVKGYRYDFRTGEFPGMNFSDDRQIGFIAQELKEVVPEAVVQGDDGYLAVNYDMIVPVLVEAYKELKTELEEIKKKLAMQNSTGVGAVNTLQIESYPNPFSNNIDVKFNLPFASGISVKIINVEGKVVKKVEEGRYEAGDNKISINTETLQPGAYILLISTEDGVYSHKVMCNK